MNPNVNVCQEGRQRRIRRIVNKNDVQILGYRPTRAPEFGEKWAHFIE